MPRLVLKFKDKVISELELTHATTTIGRKADNDIVIDNPAVSGHHCRIVLKGNTYSIEDLDSTNGIFVNGKRVEKSGLHDKDVVRVAKHSIEFVAGARGDEQAVFGDGKVGRIRVLEGVVNGNEFELKGPSIYIGKADRAQIQIKGGGIFGSAPDIAASIHRKGAEFSLVAVEQGYPRINDRPVDNRTALKDGDIIRCGGTTLQFSLKSA